MINNRQQSGRRRGRGNQRPQGGNSGGNRNQDNGNRIDNRSRGNAAQLLEKYKTLARDAQQSGDRVLTEYYLQFADHYFRVLADTRARYEENNPRRESRDDQGYEGEDGFEGEVGDEFDPRPQSRVQPPQPQPRHDREPREAREPREPREDGDDSRPPRRDRNDYNDRPRNNGYDRNNDRPAREDRPRMQRDRRPGRDPVEEEASTLSLDMLPPAIAVTPVDEEPVAAPAPKRRSRVKKADATAVPE